MSKIILIGSNHAGTACANTILDNCPENELIIFDQNSNISFLGCGMALWIGNQIEGADGLFYCSKNILEEKGAKVYLNTKVEEVDFDKKVVRVIDPDGKELTEQYDKLILATGSLPIHPNIEGMELENVQHVKLYQDALDVIEKLKKEELKKIVVVGAGYIGVELAEAFHRKGKDCTVIDMAPTCLSGYYDREFTKLMEDNLKSNGVDLRTSEMVQKLEGKDGRVSAVITDKDKYEADMVIFAIGFIPNTALGKDKLKLFRNGAYEVDLNQMTSVKDVYAIGDCATVYDNAIDQTNYIALASNAVRSGIVAGHNACGEDLKSLGVQGSNGIKIFKLCMASTGLTKEKAEKLGFNVKCSDYEDLQKPDFMKEDNPPVKIRITYEAETRRILGAQLASEYDISMMIHMFSLAIAQKMTIDSLALTDIFFLPHYNQPYNYVTMAALKAE